MSAFGGASFNGGLYRVLRASDFRRWQERIAIAFPGYEDQVACFGYDWMGTAFALDSSRKVGGRPAVAMFDLGAGEVLEIPSNLDTFHDHELVYSSSAALETELYGEWLSAGGAPPSYSQCVGYQVPLFLGGADEVGNLELPDLDVYWHIIGQVLEQVGD